MKKIVLMVAALLASALVITSCEQEKDDLSSTNANASQQVRGNRTVNNSSPEGMVLPYYIILRNDIGQLDKYPNGLTVYIADDGGLVHYINKENPNATKQEPDFSSKDKAEFYKWVEEKLEKGYTVTIIKSDGVYYGYLSLEPVEVEG